jgi:site-specific recombinase XerD
LSKGRPCRLGCPQHSPDPSHLAVAGFLARYREPTASAYRRDLRRFWQWCTDRDLAPLAAKWPHIELSLRDLERRGYAPATINRRLSTLAGLFKYAVIDEHVPTNPTAAVTRPRVPWEGQRRTVLHPLEFAAVLSAARQTSPTAHALVAMLVMLGLRVSEACNAQIEDLRYAAATNCCAWSARARNPRRYRCPSPSCLR